MAKDRATKETKKEIRGYTEGYADTVRGLTELMRENYLSCFQLSLSLWEGNLKVVNSQVDQWLNLQQNYIDSVRELYEKLPTSFNGNSKSMNDQIDRFVTFQRDYVNLSRGVSDKFAKGSLSLAQRNIEKAFSVFDNYLSLFRL